MTMVLKSVISLLCCAILGSVIKKSQQLKPLVFEKTRLQFASKTRYYRREISFEAPKDCVPLHISMVVRHGTRYPSKKDVQKIDDMLKVVNKAVNSSGQERIANLLLPWKSPFSTAHDKLLASAGEEEMYYIAKELLKRFPSLLSHPYHPQNFDFVSTGTSRAVQSAMAFAFGLFEGRGRLGPNRFQPVAIKSREIDNDPLLRFFDVCPKYTDAVTDNDTALLEYKIFKRGEEMRNVLQKVSIKMNISSNDFTEKTIVGMYTACIFEVAVFNRGDTWCQLFDDEDLLVLEYLSDLKHYWKRGYGYPITYEIGCHLLENIVSSLKNATDPSSDEKKYGNFMFAHSETLQPLYALLGLFKDREKLLADNFLTQFNRKYKTSRIVPFGANIAFALYKRTAKHDASPKESDGDETRSFIIQVFVNEELMAVPCCGGQKECPLETFLQCFDTKPSVSCNLSSLCSLEKNSAENSHVEL